jgi:hypothetical protein
LGSIGPRRAIAIVDRIVHSRIEKAWRPGMPSSSLSEIEQAMAPRRVPFTPKLHRNGVFSLPSWELIGNSLVVEPFDVARQIPRMPLGEAPKELGIRLDLIFSNLLITSA